MSIDQWVNKPYIVFDTETNGFEPEKHSVLSVAAIKYKSIDEPIEIERFQRFYFPIEPYEPKAIKINNLSEEVIKRNRHERYPLHFVDDSSFQNFCSGIENYVGHNVQFDIKFIPFLKEVNTFDTMMLNKDIVKSEWNEFRKDWKWPTLQETARYYELDFNNSEAHDSLYDVLITAKVFQKMME